jgi:hypothetical protein
MRAIVCAICARAVHELRPLRSSASVAITRHFIKSAASAASIILSKFARAGQSHTVRYSSVSDAGIPGATKSAALHDHYRFQDPSMVAFSPGQEAARRLLEGPQRYTCLVGGTRSGKTFLIVRTIIMRALQAKRSRHTILRFHANAARASIALGTLPQVIQLCFPGIQLKERRQDGYFALPNGSRIWISGLDDKERVEKILGLEYATVYLNEASQIPYSSALIAFTRLAQVTRRINQHAYVDLNPVGKYHWTNLLFGDKRDPISKHLKDPENYCRAFLNAPDNIANLSPEFLANLANLPEKQRKRFYEGAYVDEVDSALCETISVRPQ